MRRAVHIAALLVACAAAAAERVEIPGGDFEPALAPGAGVRAIHVDRFLLDRYPVTNAEFLEFVIAHPEWRRGQVPARLADARYLARWAGTLEPGADAGLREPVVQVSWYAARAYCAAAAGRLPTWSEWEFVAAADETHADARADPAWRERILAWYSVPSGRKLASVGSAAANVYGVHDLHGLVWEWVEDFSGLMSPADSRDQGDPDRLRFCGAGALSTNRREEYAVLMRIALLSSLGPADTTGNVGFRCAADALP